VWSTLGCLALSLPLALVFTRCEFPGRNLLNSLVLLGGLYFVASPIAGIF